MEVGRSSCLFALCSRSNAKCFLPDGCWFWYGHSHPGRKLMCGMGSCLAWGVFIFKFILGYEFITLSINYQFPMHPSFPYHLLRLKNHLFILRKLHFSRTRSDRHLDPGEMMGAYPTCIRHIRILLSYKMYSTNVECFIEAFKPCPTERLFWWI